MGVPPISPPGVPELVRLARGVWTHGIRWRARRTIRLAQDSRSKDVLYHFLQWRYQAHPCLERGGQFYPVAVYPALPSPNGRTASPDSVLSQRSNLCNLRESLLVDSFPNADRIELKSTFYRNEMMRAEYFREPKVNRPTFAMKAMHVDDGLAMECYLTRYFENVDSCDALEWELLTAARNWKRSDERAMMRYEQDLVLRSELHRRVHNPVRDGALRGAGVGISTLIAYEDDNGLQLMVRKRSSVSVAAHPGGIHVIPSFMFQPGTEDIGREFSAKHNILREYLEELFNVPEPELDAVDARYFYENPRMSYLRELLDRGEAELTLTGLAVNLLTLRPEICTLLYIRNPEWYERHSRALRGGDERFHTNDEFVDIHNTTQLLGHIAFSDSDDDFARIRSLHADQMVPSGAAALWLGVDALRRLRTASAAVPTAAAD